MHCSYWTIFKTIVMHSSHIMSFLTSNFFDRLKLTLVHTKVRHCKAIADKMDLSDNKYSHQSLSKSGVTEAVEKRFPEAIPSRSLIVILDFQNKQNMQQIM